MEKQMDNKFIFNLYKPYSNPSYPHYEPSYQVPLTLQVGTPSPEP